MDTAVQLSTILYEIGKWSGLIGYFFLAFLIFSGDTARYWDRFIGLDKIIKFQRKFSIWTAVFVVLHPLLFILSKQTITNYIIPDFSVPPLAFGIIALYIFVAVMIASALYKRISYTVWQYIHVLTYVLFFFSLYHALFWGSDTDAFIIPYLISCIAVIVGIIYRTQYKIKKMRAGRFLVKEIRKETEDTFTLVLSPEKKFTFTAGQFCFLRLNTNRLYARHPFTLSGSPRARDLSFTIKRAGRFTETAQNLKVGDEVLVDGPFGRFVAEPAKTLVCIAGGVGIAPFMSIIKENRMKEEKQNILLLYGSKTEKDIIFKNELDSINEDWLTKVYVISREKESSFPCEHGRIDEQMIRKYVRDPGTALFYICGPEQMTRDIKKILIGLRVDKSDIYTESFFW